MSRITVRLARPADAEAYAGAALPAEWFFGGHLVGLVAERDGEMVAIGFITWDGLGRAWGWFSRRGSVSPFLMHREARRMLVGLREAEIAVLHAFCSQSIPGSANWLARLGFVAAPELTTDPDHPVWRCDLST